MSVKNFPPRNNTGLCLKCRSHYRLCTVILVLLMTGN